MRTSTSLGAAVLATVLGAFVTSTASTSARPLARDGKIAFVRNGSIFVVNSDGSGVAKLRVVSRVQRDTGWSEPSWSPDGKRLALLGRFDNGMLGGDTRIYVRDANGATKVVTGVDYPNTGAISWSPDGKQLVSDSGGDFPRIFIVRVATGKWHRVGTMLGADPSWSPDGAWICYSSLDENSSSLPFVNGLALIRPNGRGRTQLTNAGWRPHWSPDDKRIVFADKDGIAVVDRDGSHLKRLTTRAGDDHPDWSPTGSRIVFSRPGLRSRSDLWDLWVMRADGSHQVRLVKNGDEPTWQPLH